MLKTGVKNGFNRYLRGHALGCLAVTGDVAFSGVSYVSIGTSHGVVAFVFAHTGCGVCKSFNHWNRVE